MTVGVENMEMSRNGRSEVGCDKDRFDALTSAMGAHALLLQSAFMGLDERGRAGAAANFSEHASEMSTERLRAFSKGVFIALYGDPDESSPDEKDQMINRDEATEHVRQLEVRPWHSILDSTDNLRRHRNHSSMFGAFLANYLDDEQIEFMKAWDSSRRGKFMDALRNEFVQQHMGDTPEEVKARQTADLYLPRLELVYEKIRSPDISKMMSLKTRAAISATIRLHLPRLLKGNEVQRAYALIAAADESVFLDNTSATNTAKEIETTDHAVGESSIVEVSIPPEAKNVRVLSRGDDSEADAVKYSDAEDVHYETLDSLDAYWKRIKRIPRLSHEEEIELEKQIEAGVTADYKLKNEESVDGYSSDDLKDIVSQGEQARRRLVESNLRLVAWIALQYSRRDTTVSQLDLIQEGNIALWRAVEQHDYKNSRFGAYAGSWIDKTMLNAKYKQGRSIRLPGDVISAVNSIKGMRYELEKRLGREPSLCELAKSVNMEEERVAELLAYSMPIKSLDMTIGESDTTMVAYVAEAPPPDERDEVRDLSLRTKIERVLDRLTRNEQRVIRLRFGLDDNWGRSVEETAEELGVSRRAIRNAEASAMEKLRREESTAILASKDIESPTLTYLGMPTYEKRSIPGEMSRVSQTALRIFEPYVSKRELELFLKLPQEFKDHFAGGLLALHEKHFPDLRRNKIEETVAWVMATLDGESGYDIVKRQNIGVTTLYRALGKERFALTVENESEVISELFAAAIGYDREQAAKR